MYMVRNSNANDKIPRNCRISQINNFDIDPLVDLEIDENFIPQVVVNFGSQVNILAHITWIKMGRPKLSDSRVYFKLVDHGLNEPIGVRKSV